MKKEREYEGKVFVFYHLLVRASVWIPGGPTVAVCTLRRRPWCSPCVCSSTASRLCASRSVPLASPRY